MSKIKIKCDTCDQLYDKELKDLNKNIKLGYKNYCSKKCKLKGQSTLTVTICCNCGKTITRRESELVKNKNVFCSISCSVSYNNKKTKRKYFKHCENCGAELKNPNNKCCSIKCHKENKYNEYIKSWKTGKINPSSENIPSSIEKYIRNKYNNRCSICGWGEEHPKTKKIPTTIHHKDGDACNHKEENLDLLCPNHHALTETFGALNVGNGTRKKKKYKEC